MNTVRRGGYRLPKVPKVKMDTIPEVAMEKASNSNDKANAIPTITVDNKNNNLTGFLVVIGFILMVAINLVMMSFTVAIPVEKQPGVEKMCPENQTEMKVVPYYTTSGMIVGMLNFGTGAAIILIRNVDKANRNHWNSMAWVWFILNVVMIVGTTVLVLGFRFSFELVTRGNIGIWQSAIFCIGYDYYQFHRHRSLQNNSSGHSIGNADGKTRKKQRLS